MEWMSCEGFTRADLRKIEEQIELDIEAIWNEWRRLHGEE
jgi:hypothetical protein